MRKWCSLFHIFVWRHFHWRAKSVIEFRCVLNYAMKQCDPIIFSHESNYFCSFCQKILWQFKLFQASSIVKSPDADTSSSRSIHQLMKQLITICRIYLPFWWILISSEWCYGGLLHLNINLSFGRCVEICGCPRFQESLAIATLVHKNSGLRLFSFIFVYHSLDLTWSK